MAETKGSARSWMEDWWKTACVIGVLYAATVIAVPAQTLTTLYSFCSQDNCADGYQPLAGLVQADNGELYGTTYVGGAFGGGESFEISPSGSFTVAYSFCSQSGCPDGSDPTAGLVQGTDGNLYGTAYEGGNASCIRGCGTVFRMTLTGALTVLQSFDFNNGGGPYAGLTEAANGNFYGATTVGGAYGAGEVFEIAPPGTLTTLYSFCERFPCLEGAYPYTGLVQGTNGYFYGTTSEGGTGNGCQGQPQEGCGTVFKMTSTGKLRIIDDFCGQSGCPFGLTPVGTLLQASDGNFYGATTYGGSGSCIIGGIDYGCGTVFKLTPQGALTTLYSFCTQPNCPDGARPSGGLIQGTDGNLYGTTSEGGAYYSSGNNYGGTVFKITTKGDLTTLYSFCVQANCADGESPEAALVQDTNGDFYGTAALGGAGSSCSPPGCGTVFRLSVGLGEFVEPVPNSGAVGTSVSIQGTALAGATEVTFNGTPARFTVSSSSLITTTVPEGATTGEIKVITPHGTIRSNVRFRVIK